jgi:hypothetical protein
MVNASSLPLASATCWEHICGRIRHPRTPVVHHPVAERRKARRRRRFGWRPSVFSPLHTESTLNNGEIRLVMADDRAVRSSLYSDARGFRPGGWNDQCRDGNGAPFPDSPRGIHSLGDGDGYNLLPTGN